MPRDGAMEPAGKERREDMTLRKKEAFVGILLVLPFLAGFLLFYIIPFGISVFYSFTQGIGGMNFVGMKNYRDIFGSYAFRLAAANTFRFMGIGIPLIILLSLGLSLIIFGSVGHAKIFQSVFLYPMVIPIGSVVMFFQVMLSEYGVVNRILYQLGLTEVKWLDSGAAFYVLLFLYVWKNCGYNMVLFLTGLNGIPRECEEAAKLEGAGRWQYFWYIQCPLLIPSFLFVFVMSVINSFKCYREAYLLGGRYPDDSIYMLQHFMNNNFESLNYQRLSVAAILVFLVIFALVILLFVGKYRTEQDGTGRRRRSAAASRSGGRKSQKPVSREPEPEGDGEAVLDGGNYREYRGMLLNAPEQPGKNQEKSRRRNQERDQGQDRKRDQKRDRKGRRRE